jgi:predicted DCC family thiol-disulfide oxidoreductase YuxK
VTVPPNGGPNGPAPARPLLIYDGDCGFCGYWARYWQQLTGDKVEYRPYQEVAARYPAISLSDFQRAVQFITPDGRHASAAEASFLTLSYARGTGFWLALYRNLPGFAAVSELAYAFIAARRPAFFRISLLLWGRNYEPPRYERVAFLFLRTFSRRVVPWAAAGMAGPLGPFWENDPAEWWRNQEVNLRGPMLCCREVVPNMIARKSGRIINVASGAGCQPFPELSAYVVSKTALIRFSEQLAFELAPHGISVFPIHPGTVRTRMVDESRARLPYIQAILDRRADVPPSHQSLH